nr:glycine oxidase ThiO [Nocardioides gilvus]
MLQVTVLGAGIIGLTCADELRRRGHRVRVLDPHPGAGASYAAAGMLAPDAESWHGERELFELGRESVAYWSALAERLGIGLHRRGTLLVGHDAADLQAATRQADLLAHLGVPPRRLGRDALRALEPGLGRVAGGYLLTDDLSVDPRAAVAALRSRLADVLEPVAGDLGDATRAEADAVVVATGAELPVPFTHLVRRVRGETVRVRCEDPPAHVVRGEVRGQPVYLVPRDDGEVVIGATSEEHDAAAVATLGGVARLLDAARPLWPGLDRASWLQVVARDRPGTHDNRPLVGPTHLPGVLLAAGHHRHGVLLAPLTARVIADHLEGGALIDAWDPRRFDERNPC